MNTYKAVVPPTKLVYFQAVNDDYASVIAKRISATKLIKKVKHHATV